MVSAFPGRPELLLVIGTGLFDGDAVIGSNAYFHLHGPAASAVEGCRRSTAVHNHRRRNGHSPGRVCRRRTPTASDLYNLACAYALAAAKLPPSDANRAAARTVATLRQAIAQVNCGFAHRTWLTRP